MFKFWRGRQRTVNDAPTAPTADNISSVVELVRLGALRRQQVQYVEAARILTQAIELKHDSGVAHHNLGLVYLEQGEIEDAIDSFHLATHFSPQLAAAHLDLASALAQLGQLDAADAACAHGLELGPPSAAAWLRLGNIKKARGHFEEAIACYRSAVEFDPAYADAHCQLAFLLFKLGRYPESRASHDAALAVKPDFPEARHNLGLLLLETGYVQEALQCFRHALELRPGTVETQACIAHALRDLGQLDDALAQYDAVLAAAPDFGDAVINRCHTLLMRENYASAWRAYEHRFAAAGVEARAFPCPQWQGEPLAGRRLLVYAEQGLGDEVMFASCLPDLQASGVQIVLECSSRLAPLFARSFPRAVVHGGGKSDATAWLDRLPSMDYQTAIGSLPRHLRNTAAAFPRHSGYLSADSRRVEFWQQRCAELGTGLRIGVAWRGGSLRTRQFLRSLPLDEWLPVLRQPGCSFVSLQYGDHAAELAGLQRDHGITVHDQAAQFADLDELAAAIAALDLIISVDNTVVHLAGALGRSVWVLLPHAPESRYPRCGSALRWYPSARLFRQPQPRMWQPVIGQVARELQDCIRAQRV